MDLSRPLARTGIVGGLALSIPRHVRSGGRVPRGPGRDPRL